MILRIGTRKSALAMAQTQIVADRIKEAFPETQLQIIPMSTKGDERLDRSLMSFGGKGVFTKELEEALLQGKIDLAVHSAKDLPMEMPQGLALGAVLEREDPRDVLVTCRGVPVSALPEGSVIGTGSLRRELQIRELNDRIIVKQLRGNVQTRLSKLKAGEYDGILLAAAGLKRLGIEAGAEWHFEYMDTSVFTPAAAQGILAVEIRAGELSEVMRALADNRTQRQFLAERSFLDAAGGGCNAPCAAICETLTAADGDESLTLHAMYAGRDGVLRRGSLTGDACCPEQLGRDLLKKLMYRTASLVGAGPGDAGLISVKGLSCIRRADVLIYDNLVSPALLSEAPEYAELIYAGKRAGRHYMRQEEINSLLVAKVKEGGFVVRLKGGDPFVFGRGGEEALALKEEGLSFEIVPGITSAVAVPAYAGIPVTHRTCASSFHVITGHEGDGKAEESLDFSVLAKEEGTLIFLMGLSRLKGIADALMKYGKAPDTPAAVIEKGTTSGQRMAAGTLATIARDAEDGQIHTPAITLIGQTAALYEDLSWFGKAPLSGKKILLTGTKPMNDKQARLLKPLGAEVIPLSLIRTHPIWSPQVQDVLKKAGAYQWIVFTSRNGVSIVFDHWKREKVDLRSLAGVKFAVIGEETGRELEERGFLPDFCPKDYSSEGLAEEWIPGLSKQDRVLLLRAREASQVLNTKLSEAGIEYLDMAVYETQTDMRMAQELIRASQEADYVTFASASAVKAFAGMLASKDQASDVHASETRMLDHSQLWQKPEQLCVAAIGPATQAACAKAGITADLTAVQYTAEGLLAVILEHEEKQRN